eukprot:353453-Chlamydomonas_euryale.AAC.1
MVMVFLGNSTAKRGRHKGQEARAAFLEPTAEPRERGGLEGIGVQAHPSARLGLCPSTLCATTPFPLSLPPHRRPRRTRASHLRSMNQRDRARRTPKQAATAAPPAPASQGSAGSWQASPAPRGDCTCGCHTRVETRWCERGPMCECPEVGCASGWGAVPER